MGDLISNNNNDLNNKIRFIYSNCQKKKSATQLLSVNMLLHSDIIGITEPWLGKKCKATFTSPWKVHATGIDSRAILITPPWSNAFLLTRFCDKDAIFCRINTNDLNLIVGVMYVEAGMLDPTWANKFNELSNICPRIIILSDSNAHSKLWGYKKSDKKGESWEESLSLAGFEVFTDKYMTTFENSRQFSSCIDIAFGTPIMKTMITERINEIIPSLSDHKIWGIKFNIQSESDQSSQFKLKTVDWDKFNQTLERNLVKLTVKESLSQDELENMAIDLNKAIIDTMEECINKSSKKPKVRWWNPELSCLQEKLKQETRFEEKETLKRQLEEKMLMAQANDWKAFASMCNSISDAFLKNKLLNMEKKDLVLHPIKKHNGEMTESAEETANTMLESWFKMKSEFSDLKAIEDRINRLMPLPTNTENITLIDQKTIFATIQSMRPYSAPGYDGIPNIVIQKAAHILCPLLSVIFNNSLILGSTPKVWKKGKVVLIPKGKARTNTTKDFRPITLLPVIVKIFEKVILKRLQQQASDKGWISNEQFGFQPGRSATHALMDYSAKISSCIKLKKPVAGIHLDLEGAFDSVWKPILIKRLMDCNCPEYLVNWLNDYLSERTQMFENSSFYTEVNVEKSTPQGGSLSPFLWSLIIDPVIPKIKNMGVEISVFADDLSILIARNTWFGVGVTANKVLQEIQIWANKNALKFNPEKSVYIQYSRQRSVEELRLKMNNVTLKRVNQVKFLGVIFTEKLTWKSHITYVANKAVKNLFALSAIVNRTWGLGGKYLRTLYLGAIEPMILYSCPVWAIEVTKNNVRKQLNRVQRIAGQMITRCNSKTHSLDIMTLAGIMPLHIRAKELALRWWAGASVDMDNPCSRMFEQLEIHKEMSGHFSNIQQLDSWFRQMGINKENLDLEYSALKTRLKAPTPESIFDSSPENSRNPSGPNKVMIYTDGSKSQEGVGSAFTVWKNGVQINSWACSLDEDTSIFKAELIAFTEAVEEAFAIHEQDIEIITDSQAVLASLKTPSRNAMVEDLRNRIIVINQTKNVKLKWTRAHVGDIGNESADLLAKKISSTRPTNGSMPPDKMDLIRQIKKQVKWEWQLLWDSRINKWLYKWKPKVNKNVRMEHFNNHETELLNNFFAGSIPLNRKLHLWGLRDSPHCDVDNNTNETPSHYLFVCDQQRVLRENIQSTIMEESGHRMFTYRAIWKSDNCLKLLVDELIKRFPP